jgi:hypothetical protein
MLRCDGLLWAEVVHDDDVRGVSAFGILEGAFLTASRDRTAKLWSPTAGVHRPAPSAMEGLFRPLLWHPRFLPAKREGPVTARRVTARFIVKPSTSTGTAERLSLTHWVPSGRR